MPAMRALLLLEHGEPPCVMNRMRRIDRYFLGEMLIPALIGGVMVLMLLLGNRLYELLRYIYQGAPAKDVLMILVYYMPGIVMMALPGALLLGTALALNRLERDREILSLRMAGIRLKRLVLPYIIVGVLGSLGLFYLQERVIPECTHKAIRMTYKLTYGTPTAMVPRDVVTKLGENFLYVREVNPQTQTLYGVVVCKMEPRGYPMWLTIPRAENRHQRWFFKRDPVTGEFPRVYMFNDKGELTNYVDVEGEDSWLDLNQQKDVITTFFDQPSTPDELTFGQLRGMRNGLRAPANFGFNLAPAQLTYYLHQKIAKPLGALVAILIAIPLAVRYGRSGGYVGLLLSVVVAFCFVVSNDWAKVLAETNHLHPLIAAWGPNAFFGLLGLGLLLREE